LIQEEELFQMVMLPLNGVNSQNLELLYEGAQGTPISYIYNDSGRLLQDTNSALIFIPAQQTDIVLVQNCTPANPNPNP
jgi:hypothetical protein